MNQYPELKFVPYVGIQPSTKFLVNQTVRVDGVDVGNVISINSADIQEPELQAIRAEYNKNVVINIPEGVDYEPLPCEQIVLKDAWYRGASRRFLPAYKVVAEKDGELCQTNWTTFLEQVYIDAYKLLIKPNLA